MRPWQKAVLGVLVFTDVLLALTVALLWTLDNVS